LEAADAAAEAEVPEAADAAAEEVDAPTSANPGINLAVY
jgi:hypothetical protein